jgi:hypothetical protein
MSYLKVLYRHLPGGGRGVRKDDVPHKVAGRWAEIPIHQLLHPKKR